MAHRHLFINFLCSLLALSPLACVVTSGPPPAPASVGPAAPPPAVAVAPEAPPPATQVAPPARPSPMSDRPALASTHPDLRPHPASQPLFVPTPEPRERPVHQPRGAALGMPRDFRERRDDALWIWHDERNGEWHVRTTTRGQPHRFSGRIWVNEGSFADVRPSKTEFNDRLRAAARSLEFDFYTQGGADGFDFRSTGGAGGPCVSFALFVDGRADAGRIEVGAGGTHPANHIFTLCP